MVLLVAPAAIGLLVLAGPLIAVIYSHGRFTHYDTYMSTYPLMAYALGLPAFSLVKVLAPGYFARQDARTPVRIGIIALAVNIGFNLSVVLPAAKIFHVPAPHTLLALSTGIASTVNASLLFRGLRRSGIYHAGSGWPRLAGQVTFACVVMAAGLWWLAGDLSHWLELRWAPRALRLVLCVFAGGALYFGALLVTGWRPRELRHLTA